MHAGHDAGGERASGIRQSRITFSGGGPNGIGGKEEFSATGVLQSDGTLVGDLISSTSGKPTWKAVRTVTPE